MLGFKVLICAIFAVSGAAAAGCGFGYDGELGPDHWGDEYEQCLGKHQSPINIDSAHLTRVHLDPLKMDGFELPLGVATLTNNGHTAMLTTDTEIKPILSGGPLNGEYEFAQLHFHWGDNDTKGSEDEIDGKTFPMEMHLVFYKKEYLNSDAALDYPDGLCVLAVFFEVDENHNDNFNGFSEILPEIVAPETSATFDVAPSLLDLLPNDFNHYFTYFGSLTTPPCAEVVTWIDLKNPIKLSHDQFESFRSLLNEEETPMSNNFRAIQPLGDRIVLYNTDVEEVEMEHEVDKIIDEIEILLSALRQLLLK